MQLSTALRPGQAKQKPPEVSQDNMPHEDELGEYLKLPQIENTGEWCGIKWWAANKT